MSSEENMNKIFTIIAQAGDAKGSFYEAFKLVKDKKYEEADKKIKDGEEALNEAHKIQTELIVNEANGNKTEVGILMVHAQDHLMNVILIKELLDNMMSMQKEINILKM